MLRFKRQLHFVIPDSAKRNHLRLSSAGWSKRHCASATKSTLTGTIEHAHGDHISSGADERTGHNIVSRQHVTVRRLSSNRTDLRAVEICDVLIVNRRKI